MNKIWLVIKREYLTRIRKKSFIILTLIGPILFGGIMLIPVWLSQLEDAETKTIAVVEYDSYGQPVPDTLLLFKNVIPDKEKLKFQYVGGIEPRQIETILRNSDYYGFLILRYGVLFSGEEATAEIITKKQPSFAVIVHIEKSLEQFIHDSKLLKYNIPIEIVNSIKTKVNLKTVRLRKNQGVKEQKNIELKIAISYLCGFMIYMFIFMFSSQVMRGVIEEKTNRIIEVIITSVKPFQLLAGKIAGISFLGITQLIIWVILTFGIYQAGATIFLKSQLKDQMEMNQLQPTDLFGEQSKEQEIMENPLDQIKEAGILSAISTIPFGLIIITFFFYFLGGYLLYASFFACIGAAVDNETDTQQFMLPVTIPLIISLIALSGVIMNPESSIAIILSYIPFTSPIIMMARIPFDVVPISNIIISIVLLYATVIGAVWLSARIYRVGILMYGKKASFKEMIKWVRYKVG